MARVAVPFALVVLLALASVAQAAPHVRFFLSPSRNISCEVDYGRVGVRDAAYCQSYAPALSVTLGPSGRARVCSGQGCLGNPPERTPVLAYGRSVTLGPFHCSSRSTGVTCRSAVAAFTISRAGVTTIAATPKG